MHFGGTSLEMIADTMGLVVCNILFWVVNQAMILLLGREWSWMRIYEGPLSVVDDNISTRLDWFKIYPCFTKSDRTRVSQGTDIWEVSYSISMTNSLLCADTKRRLISELSVWYNRSFGRGGGGGAIAVEEDKSKKLIWIAMFLQALVSYLLITSVFSSVDIQNANKMKSCYSCCLFTTKHCCTFLRFSSVISRAFQLLPLQLNYIFTRKRHTTR